MCTIKLSPTGKPVNQASIGDKSDSKLVNVITHDGVYHADDVVAIALLASVMKREVSLVVTRTRVKEDINAGDVVIDVGGVYSPEMARFDHHFKGSPEREDGTLFASAGLILAHFLPEAISANGPLAEFVRRVDAVDTGTKVPEWRFSKLLSKTNPLPGSNREEYDARFLELVEIVRNDLLPILKDSANADELEETIKATTSCFENHPRVSGWIQDNHLAQTASAARITAAFSRAVAAGDYLVKLDQPEVALYDTLGSAPAGLYYVTFPSDGNHKVQQIPVEAGSFTGRLPLPEAWAGKEGLELQALTGVGDAVFCHPGRFIAGAETAAGAVRLAELAMSAKP